MSSCEIDVICNKDELAGGEVGADAAGGVGDDQRFYAEAGEDADGKDDLAGGAALVGVDAALHDGERSAGEAAENQAAGVAFDRGAGEVRDLGVGDRDLVCQAVGESAETGAEDDTDVGAERGSLADEGGGALGFVEG
jgi:hypothetical protein